jgi:hypothetical protein
MAHYELSAASPAAHFPPVRAVWVIYALKVVVKDDAEEPTHGCFDGKLLRNGCRWVQTPIARTKFPQIIPNQGRARQGW